MRALARQAQDRQVDTVSVRRSAGPAQRKRFGAGGGQQAGADQAPVLLESVEDAQTDGGPLGHGEGEGPGKVRPSVRGLRWRAGRRSSEQKVHFPMPTHVGNATAWHSSDRIAVEHASADHERWKQLIGWTHRRETLPTAWWGHYQPRLRARHHQLTQPKPRRRLRRAWQARIKTHPLKLPSILKKPWR